MSNQPKHTPGPWYWDDKDALPWTDYDETIHAPFLMDANGSIVMSGDDIRINNEANARLIAAAPDLLDVLKSSLNEHKEVREFLNVRISEGESVYVWLEETETMIGRIEAAIAKAEGREV